MAAPGGTPETTEKNPRRAAGRGPARRFFRKVQPLPVRRRRRTRQLLASRGVFDSLVSLVGLIGRPVRNQAGQEIGRLVDVLARWSDGQTYPPVSGLVVRVGRRLTWVDVSAIATIEQLAARIPGLKLINAYGSTETTSPSTIMPPVR